MKLFRFSYIVLLVFSISSAIGLLYVSHNVQLAEKEYSDLKYAIVKKQEEIRVLEAEWAYLNNPEYLDVLAREYLFMIPPNGVESVWSALPDFPVSPLKIDASVLGRIKKPSTREDAE